MAQILCDEAALALGCPRVGLWQLGVETGGDWLAEVFYSGKRFEDQVPRRTSRRESPAFFAALERRRSLEGKGLHEFEDTLQGGHAATILVDGGVWGVLSFEGAVGARGGEGDLDFALVMAEMIGRCIERGRSFELRAKLERSEEALAAFARMMGESLTFEVVDGRLECHGDPRLLLGPPPAGGAYDYEVLKGHIREEERGVLERRFRDWAGAGAPGVLSARFHYRAGLPGEPQTEIELDCRLMRSRSAQGFRLWGVLRQA